MMKNFSTLGSILALVGGGALIIVIAIAAVRQTHRTNGIEQEIAQLQAEADRVRQDNALLQDRVSYFSSEEFQEREAKEKLGLQKEGEQMVMIRPSVSQEAAEEQFQQNANIVSVAEEPNYKKWWHLFFHS